MRGKQALIFVIMLFSIWSCQMNTEKHKSISPESGRYIFLGHTYHWYSNDRIDFRIQSLDLKDYEMVLLGGDICSESSRSDTSLLHIDSIFNISNPKVLWAIGNHDLRNGNLALIEKYTKRKSYYAKSINGLTFLVLNTNFEHSNLSTEQKEDEYKNQLQLISNLSDTITKSSHLIVLSHNVVWKDLDSTSRTFANVSKPYSFSADSSISFITDIYPNLIKIQKKNIDVIWIAGDIGKWSKNYSFKSVDGIQFLASGINNTMFLKNPDKHPNPPKDKVLIFNYDKENKKLYWNFVDLNFLYFLSQLKEKGYPETKADSLCLQIDSLYRNQEEAISVYSKRIKNTKSWLNKVKEKAHKRDIPLKEMIYRDARFLNDKMRKEKLNELYQLIPNPLFYQTNNSTKHLE